MRQCLSSVRVVARVVRAVAVALEAWHPRHPRDIARGGEFFTRARLFRRRPRSTRARARGVNMHIYRA